MWKADSRSALMDLSRAHTFGSHAFAFERNDVQSRTRIQCIHLMSRRDPSRHPFPPSSMSMSRFTTAWIPTHGQHVLASFFIIRDILLFIFEHCSPYDLVQLNATCRTFRSLIRDQPHLWDYSFHNMARGASPALPPCPLIQSAGYSIPAYITWIFGGGPCSVQECEKFSKALPFDFVWGFRACSPDCEVKLTSEEYLHYDWNCQFRTLGMFRHLPHVKVVSHGMDVDLYPKQAIVTSGMTLTGNIQIMPLQTPITTQDRQLLDDNASELKSWKTNYLVETKAVTRANMEFILKRANEDLEKAKKLLQYKAVRAAVAVFSRDLQLLTECVWTRLDIPTELKAHCPIDILAAQPDKQCCGDCPNSKRLFTPQSLESHQLAKHPHLVVKQPCPEEFAPYAFKAHRLSRHPAMAQPLANLKRCVDCPALNRLFTEDSLEHHQQAKHPDRIVMQCCGDCPQSAQMFTMSRLRAHRLAKHPA
ncbi:hypothetical protein MIND_00688100 [Mycena indigotica]|uniref:F-box domain-containing protein n=1 Tax=Mycena indigotica TaxID=2126181 RepID=A0A8H6W4A5_9AGAR|nr:uncharacterized protein MIND_00688100 [Mycena indigotica]KAF7301233.1 hypothetical protein MIND_00688100 [Mycena indigotica]